MASGVKAKAYRIAQLELAIVRCTEQLEAGDRSEGVQNYLRTLLIRHQTELAKLKGLKGVVMAILANQRAFLAMISHSEGTDKAADPYRVCFGFKHTISGLIDHPAVTGEWHGEKLSDEMCKAAGHGPNCVSTAAGKYQLIRPTWVGVKARLRLPDFSDDSQDRAALYLIDQRGALEDVHAGRIQTAITKCAQEWASMPGSGWGQPERRVQELVAAFTQAGGQVLA